MHFTKSNVAYKVHFPTSLKIFLSAHSGFHESPLNRMQCKKYIFCELRVLLDTTIYSSHDL